MTDRAQRTEQEVQVVPYRTEEARWFWQGEPNPDTVAVLHVEFTPEAPNLITHVILGLGPAWSPDVDLDYFLEHEVTPRLDRLINHPLDDDGWALTADGTGFQITLMRGERPVVD